MDGIAIAGLVVAVIGTGYTVYAGQNKKKLREERQHLLAQFNANRTLCQQVKNELEEYATTNGYLDGFMFPNITYRAYIAELENSLDTNLSLKYIDEIKSPHLTSSNIASLTKSLETQFNALTEIQKTTALMKRSGI